MRDAHPVCAPRSETTCTDCDPARTNPDRLEHRVVLIGDAGEPLSGAAARLRDSNFERARQAALSDTTTFVFLGDNVYPDGVPVDPPGREDALALLDPQLDIVGQNARGIVIPGNHDWDSSGRRGLDHIREQARYVDARRPTGGPVQFQPKDGCPGPIYLDLGERVRLIFIDSEWLLRGGRKQTAGCHWGSADAPVPYDGEAGTELTVEHFAETLSSIVPADRDLVLLAHHPVRTAGSHAGNRPWWQHLLLFSFYKYLTRSEQDLGSEQNERMRVLVRDALSTSGADPIIHASGHEHGLQVFDAPRMHYLVSGSGSKSGACSGRC